MNVTNILNKAHNKVDSTIGNANFLNNFGLPLVTSINFSSANSFSSNQNLIKYHNSKYNSLRYNRDAKDNIYQSEMYFKYIFNKDYSLIFDSGMRAVTVAINSLLPKIDKIYLPYEVYRKTRDYCFYLKDIGAIDEVIIYDNLNIDLSNLSQSSLIILESFSNPHLIIPDFNLISEYKKKYNCKIILDSTFVAICNTKVNLEFIDIEVQSLTKYIGGYNDLIGGVIVTNDESIYKSCWDIRSREGGVLDSMSGYLLIRSLRDFDLRWSKQNSNRKLVYEYLKNNNIVSKIFLPNNQDNFIQNELFSKYYHLEGSVMSFISKIDVSNLSDNLKNFKAIKIAPSFGSIDTLIEIPSIMSHYGKSDSYFEDIKLEKNLIRMSIGCEPVELIINDLNNLLSIND